MPQETNLNNSPYFDDFNRDNEYYRVLFKPGFPVQARELTTLQSILQNQIEQFGKHFFKEGSKVIPGNLTYDNDYDAVELEPTSSGIDISLYLKELVGKRIKGSRSGVTATVRNYILAENSERGNNTLYIKYEGSNKDTVTKEFSNGEQLTCNSRIVYGTRVIPQNQPFAVTIANNATSTGSAMSIGDGVYFVRGIFSEVQKQTLILDQYSPNPSYRIGLVVTEKLITADDDPNLNDNAQGFSNYSAPGADRLKVTLTLEKRPLDSYEDKEFVEIARVDDGILQTFVNNTQYNLIRDELAKRTFEESGNYYVKPFDVFIKESLDDREGNKGVFLPNRKTDDGNTPSEALLALEISPGKAYVKGYDIEKIASTIIDVPKPRTTTSVKNVSINFNAGTQIGLNNIYGSPAIGIGTTATIELLSNRMVGSSYHSTGNSIGQARVYDFKADAASYVNPSTPFVVSLFDVEIFTTIELNSNITLAKSSYVEGKRSGASGFVVSAVTNSKTINLTSVTGTFYKDEQISVNEIDNGRIITKVIDYTADDVLAMRSSVGIVTFSADLNLSSIKKLSTSKGSSFLLTRTSGNSGIITCGTQNFAGIVTSGNIISYSTSGLKVPTFNVITGVSTDGDTIFVSGVSTVTGICDGGVPSGSTTLTDLALRKSLFTSGDNSLVTPLRHSNIKSVDVTRSNIQLRKRYNDLTISSSSFTSPSAGTDLFFQPFDEERYFISYDDGTIENLTRDKFSISADKKTVTFKGLSKSSGKADLLATVLKSTIRTKEKTLKKATVLTITRSKQSSSKNSVDGLTYSTVYGTRVQDEKISLNVCDVADVIGIFESDTNSDPDLPSAIFTSFTGPSANTSNLVLGERIVGETSGAVATVCEIPTSTKVSFVYRNSQTFNVGEKVTFESSGINAIVSSCSKGDKEITDYYTASNGMEPGFYNYGFLIRKKNSPIPSRRMKIVYDHFTVESSDRGDFFTASSYSQNDRIYLTSINGVSSKQDSLIDIRPRVSNYSTSSSISPFDFSGRDFTSSGASVSDPLVSDESLIISYEFYLPRIDCLYLDKDGKFLYQKGTPSLNPTEPRSLDESIKIATLTLPAYTYSATEVTIQKSSHKRYRMSDISKLEQRIFNVEYYTQLSLLEADTSNLTIADSSGLDRFKCGFFVDNFKSHNSHSPNHPDFEASIDKSEGILRPSHFTTALDLMVGSESLIGIGSTANPDVDANFVTDLDGVNIKKSGRMLTLTYSEVKVIDQPFASRIENVNPFAVVFYQGTLELSPQSDVWIDQKRISALTPEVNDLYDKTIKELGVDEKTGFAPIEWSSWETYHTSVQKSNPVEIPGTRETTVKNNPTAAELKGVPNRQVADPGRNGLTTLTRTTADFTTTETTTSQQARSGIQSKVTPVIESVDLGDRIVSRDIIPYMRSRNIEFRISRLKPNTRFYVFFDGVDVTKYCTPKFIEITMYTGSTPFKIGEKVTCKKNIDGDKKQEVMTFRVAHPQHLEGDYRKPSDRIGNSPYDNSKKLQDSYTSTSTVLNADLFSLSSQITEFNGYLNTGFTLNGVTSGAEARVTNQRLVSDDVGDLYGTLYIPDPNVKENPRWETGSKTIRFTTSSTNSKVGGVVQSSAEASFYSQGELDTIQQTTLSIKLPLVESIPKIDTRTVTTVDKTTQKDVLISQSSTTYYDPLAQSFAVDEKTGIFCTSVEVYFRTKDDKLPVTMQLREMKGGFPTTTILPFSVVKLTPDKVNISEDASKPTKFTFESPVYLQGTTEYAVVLVTISDKYEAWISRMGEIDISTINLENSKQVVISSQPYLGSLFKSQNGATWDASQLEDLKMKVYKAQFVSQPGIVRFYNPELHKGNNQLAKLAKNPIRTNSKRAIVGLGTTFSNVDVVPGVKISQQNNTTATATLILTAGTVATGSTSLTITNAGVGYTPYSGSATYYDVPLDPLEFTSWRQDQGSGLVGIVTITDGRVSGVTVTSGGKNFSVGNVVGISTIGDGNGRFAQFTVGIISATNALVVKDIQGQFTVGVNTVTFTDPDTLVTSPIVSGGVINEISYSPTFDGLHFRVNHRAHAMNSFANFVEISSVDSDVSPTRLSDDYAQNSTDSINVVSTANFSSFEGVGVGTTNPGYIQIDDEIIRYTGTTATSLTGITRSIDSTPKASYDQNDSVFKYEFKGVSLRRINKVHNKTLVTIPGEDYLDEGYLLKTEGLDHYYLKVDMSSNGTNRSSGVGFPKLFFKETSYGGGNSVYASQNIQFETLTPNIQTMLPSGTSISGRVRTISATSIGGNEESFIDQGFQEISLNSQNSFDTPRMIASRVNEDYYLTNLPANKSFTLEVLMNSDNRNLSPVIDLDRVSMVTTTNRINVPFSSVDSWKTHPAPSKTGKDPCIATYVSKVVELENPATSLKVLFAAFRNLDNDIRVFYKIIRVGATQNVTSEKFVPFPGYGNINSDGNVILIEESTGLPDDKVIPSRTTTEFKEFTYTANPLPKFTKFQIKIDMTSTNQAIVPKIKDLRAIALA